MIPKEFRSTLTTRNNLVPCIEFLGRRTYCTKFMMNVHDYKNIFTLIYALCIVPIKEGKLV